MGGAYQQVGVIGDNNRPSTVYQYLLLSSAAIRWCCCSIDKCCTPENSLNFIYRGPLQPTIYCARCLSMATVNCQRRRIVQTIYRSPNKAEFVLFGEELEFCLGKKNNNRRQLSFWVQEFTSFSALNTKCTLLCLKHTKPYRRIDLPRKHIERSSIYMYMLTVYIIHKFFTIC